MSTRIFSSKFQAKLGFPQFFGVQFLKNGQNFKIEKFKLVMYCGM